MDHKIKRPYGPWVPSQDTDIRKTFERARVARFAAIPIRKVKQ